MRLFYHRPLSLIIFIILGSFSFIALSDSKLLKIIVASLSAISLIVIVILHIKKKIRGRFKIVCLSILLLSLIFSSIIFDYIYDVTERFDGKTVSINAEITDYDTSRGALHIKTKDVNGKPFSSYRLIAYPEDFMLTNISVGQEITLSGVIDPCPVYNGTKIGDPFASRGIVGLVHKIENLEIKKSKGFTFEYYVRDFRDSLSRTIILTSSEDEGGFLAALMLGNQDYLSDPLALDFKRTGITHILALSGQHLVIIAAALYYLLGKFNLGRKPSTVIVMLFVIFYVIITGMSSSIVRSGIMFIISSLLFLFASARDGVTNLFISILLIFIFDPYAVYDLGLWLSALATLGILMYIEYSMGTSEKPTFLNWFLASMTATFFAIAATLIITVSLFNETSLLAGPATVIFSFITELFLYFGFIHLLIGWFIPTGYIVIIFGKLISTLCHWLSSIDFTVTSVNFVFIRILAIIFTAFFFAFLILNVKKKKKAVIALVIFMSSILCLSSMLTASFNSLDDIIYYNENSENIIIKDNGKITVIHTDKFGETKGWYIADILSEMHVNNLESYIYTGYDEKAPETLAGLLALVKTDTLLIPMPERDSETEIYNEILEICDDFGTEIVPYTDGDIKKIDSASFIPIYYSSAPMENRIMFTIHYRGKFYTYSNTGMLEGITKTMAFDIINESHMTIFGHHGFSDSEYVFTQNFKGNSKIIFTDENIFVPNSTKGYYIKEETELLFEVEKLSLIR